MPFDYYHEVNSAPDACGEVSLALNFWTETLFGVSAANDLERQSREQHLAAAFQLRHDEELALSRRDHYYM